jgi:hypothetical protein
VVSGRSLDRSRATIGGMAANNSCGGRSLRYGNTRENVLSIDALLADGARRISAGRADLSDCPRLAAPPLARDLFALGAREADEIARAFPRCSAGSAATISTRWCRAATTSTSRTSWSAPRARSLLHRDRAQAVAAARQRARRRLPLRLASTTAMAAAQHIVKLAPIAVELVDAP